MNPLQRKQEFRKIILQGRMKQQHKPADNVDCYREYIYIDAV
jgi:hypothetical protein